MIVTDLSNSFNPYPKPNKKEKGKPKNIKKKSSKLAKLEKNRFCILTDNLKICYICDKRRKDDLHEIFGGCNRQKSMEWGLVIPICRICHKDWKINEELRKKIQQKAKEAFIKKYGKEKFLKEFGKNYIKKEKINEN